MGKIMKPELSSEQKRMLENGFKHGRAHFLRLRCQVILLKAEGKSSSKIQEITGMCQPSTNMWVRRFMAEGMQGLENRPGQGAKPIMDCSDEEAVRSAIERDRQSVKAAKEAWQRATSKEASDSTFRRFLSALVQDISV